MTELPINKLKLEPLNPVELSLGNAFAQHVHDIAVSLGDTQCYLRYTGYYSHKASAIGVTLELRLGEIPLLLSFDELAVRALFEHYLPGQALLELPDTLLIAVIEARLATLLQHIEQTTGAAIVCKTRVPPRRAKPSVYRWCFQLIQNSNILGTISLVGLENTQAAVMPVLQALAPDQNLAGHWQDVPITATVFLGSVRVYLQEYTDLTFGDVLLIEEFGRGKDPETVIVQLQPNLTTTGRLYANMVSIQDPLEIIMNDNEQDFEAGVDAGIDTGINTDTAVGEETATDDVAGVDTVVDHLQIKLMFEVGEKVLPLHELQSIREGYTFELERMLEKPVRIHANGQVVGSGELVQIGQRLGVRVLELKHGSAG